MTGRTEDRAGDRRMDVSGLLEVHNLTKKFGPLTAVDDVSFSIAQGEVGLSYSPSVGQVLG
ncbi:MAG: hypothetical protein IID55_08505 [Proteobacteria bacterium]|nr:hypothetical protein [Pseudomonadota bacterium]